MVNPRGLMTRPNHVENWQSEILSELILAMRDGEPGLAQDLAQSLTDSIAQTGVIPSSDRVAMILTEGLAELSGCGQAGFNVLHAIANKAGRKEVGIALLDYLLAD